MPIVPTKEPRRAHYQAVYNYGRCHNSNKFSTERPDDTQAVTGGGINYISRPIKVKVGIVVWLSQWQYGPTTAYLLMSTFYDWLNEEKTLGGVVSGLQTKIRMPCPAVLGAIILEVTHAARGRQLDYYNQEILYRCDGYTAAL